ncbi:hypothetical protein ACFXAE_26870 [Streptomyces sp. NPDC059454]|uniref:hypothetical protein n=1 Tax=Streptomyces sp. NPDC059454 TaxID=3346836 RepID=UPI0036936865
MAAPSPRRRNLARPTRIAPATGGAFVVAGTLAVPGAYAAPAREPAAGTTRPRDGFDGDGRAGGEIRPGSVWCFRSSPTSVAGGAGSFGAGALGTVAAGHRLRRLTRTGSDGRRPPLT